MIMSTSQSVVAISRKLTKPKVKTKTIPIPKTKIVRQQVAQPKQDKEPQNKPSIIKPIKPRTTALELCRFGFSCCSFPPLHALGGLSVTLLNSINDGLHEGNQPGTKPFTGYKPALDCPSMHISCDPQDYLTFARGGRRRRGWRGAGGARAWHWHSYPSCLATAAAFRGCQPRSDIVTGQEMPCVGR